MPAFDALVNRVVKLVLAGDPRDLALAVPSADTIAPPPKKTNKRETKNRNGSGGMSGAFGPTGDGKDRINKYRDMNTIDHEVPEAAVALDTVAANTTSGEPGSTIAGFELEYDPSLGDQGKEIAEGVLDRTQMRNELAKVVRSANKLADAAVQTIVDTQGLIWELQNLEPALLYRRHDEYNRLAAWHYRGFEDQQQDLSPWEVVHLAHSPELGALWGRSMFEAGREIAYSLIGVRNGLTFQTVNHAASRMAFILGRPMMMDPSERDTWLDEQYEIISKRKAVDSTGRLDRRMVQTINDQHLVIDYPINVDGKGAEPKIYPMGAAALDQLVAVCIHVRDIFAVLLRTPRAFIGIEDHSHGIGSNKTEMQEIQYAKLLNSEQHQAAWFVLQVIARQFLFLGVPLQKDQIKIVMPDLRVLDRKVRADTMLVLLQAAVLADSLGLPFKYIWTDILWDGDQKVAESAAARVGLDLDNQDATRAAQKAAAQAAQAALMKKGAQDGNGPPQGASAEQLIRHAMRDVDLVRRRLEALVGARVGNQAVLPR